MLYIELIRLWDEAVRLIDGRDWKGALTKLNQITEHNCRTLFTVASAHIALGQVDMAIKALDQVIAKDQCLAVGFFQRAAVHTMANRLEEALSDCIWAQKYMRENPVIDYKQLGLRYKMYSWQVLYNAAAVHSRLQQWDKANEILQAASQERGVGRSNLVETALEKVSKREVLTPLLVPEGEVFRPRKQEVEQLKPRNFLGEAKVITSLIPNDDFRGFDPLRPQTPGYYEPKIEGQDSRYMTTTSAYVAKGAGELTVPAGAQVFVHNVDDRDGLAIVIYDGQRGLVPKFLLEPRAKKNKEKNKRIELANGIPHPPALNPPNRPQGLAQPRTELRPSSAPSAAHTTPPMSNSSTHVPAQQAQTSAQEHGSVTVKVHYKYTMALRVPLETSFRDLQEKVARKLGQPATNIRLRHKKHGTAVLTPLDGDNGLNSLEDVIESRRATIWCQSEDPLANRTILYQMVALYDYTAQGPEDLEFSEGDTIDILSEVNEEWLEGHTAGNIGIFPRSFAHR
ncbi:NADPH oxidase activator 1 [Triplophysa rosa]|uniref:NADPH oxidase activator 1-like n=1 Tax=Triplophysa rosa TaxID=992332 RepID=A0A9W7X160_TRIRA|nr:NADPH oxidase activator 1 [Triplophysa rosa]XP_057212688.1 NADPH oxidase activator 1 [Triplophysa rosa]KAI7812567.1 putative NADPH oxidase activator 1-like [Triplophysa rosa]